MPWRRTPAVHVRPVADSWAWSDGREGEVNSDEPSSTILRARIPTYRDIDDVSAGHDLAAPDQDSQPGDTAIRSEEAGDELHRWALATEALIRLSHRLSYSDQEA